MEITILGCGSSSGVPSALGWWGNCDPHNTKNLRTRSSVHVAWADQGLLIDTATDLRAQLLRESIRTVTGVLMTHAHADHCNGIDELRQMYRQHDFQRMPIYAEAETMAQLHQSFSYLFQKKTKEYPPILDAHILDGAITIADVTITPFMQYHGSINTTGFLFTLPNGKRWAYSTDVLDLPESAFDLLTGLDLWIIATIQSQPHGTHAHIDKALGWIDRVQAQRGVLTHLSAKIDYATESATLPSHVQLAYDGLKLRV